MKDQIIRFAFEISEEQQRRANKYFTQYGMRKAVFSRILDDVLDILEKVGPAAFGVLMDPETKPREVIRSLNRAERVRVDDL